MLLVIIDAHSKWMEVHVMTSSSAKETIENLQITFSQLGLPTTVVSDNGPCFGKEEFKQFLKWYKPWHFITLPPSLKWLSRASCSNRKASPKEATLGLYQT